MVNPSKALYLNRKKLVIKDIDYLIDSRSKKEERTKKSTNSNFVGLTKKTYSDFLKSIKNSNTEMEQMEEDIEMILIAANEDKNILEECENYIQQKYKVHLARIQYATSVLQFVIFCLILASIMTFSQIVFFLVVDTNKINNVDGVRIISAAISTLTSFVAAAAASAAATNILMPILKPLFVENTHLISIFAYEYCIELLKNAKIRTNLVISIDPSLHLITINPNKMNGQPCIRDLRLTVWRVLELLQTYPDRSELYREFPELTEEDINQAIIYADINQRESAEVAVVINSIA